MLAATSTAESQRFDLLIFALSRIQAGDADLSPALHEYLQKVIHQAKQLASAPETVTEPLLPEAVQLALQMRSKQTVRAEVEGIQEGSVVSADDASRLRHAVEQAFVR